MPYMKRVNGKSVRDYDRQKPNDDKNAKNRAKRNAARREAIREGKASVGDGTHVDHKKPLSEGGSNGKSNTRVVSAKTNLKKEANRKKRK
jgi:hypothetical protein